MRRVIAIAILLLLPLQLVWGAGAAYCNHETGAGAKHWGHHEHFHKTFAGKSAKAGEKALGSMDPDCSFCHLSHGQSLAVAFVLPVFEALQESYTYSVSYRSYIPTGLERPDRHLAA